MSIPQNTCFVRSRVCLFLLLVMPIVLMEIGVGCAQISTDEPKNSKSSSFSVYALSRGKGVPEEARLVLDHARQVFKVGQDQGKVKRLVDRRIGLEGETQLCAEFSDEQAADRFFSELHYFSRGVDLVNMKKEICHP